MMIEFDRDGNPLEKSVRPVEGAMSNPVSPALGHQEVMVRPTESSTDTATDKPSSLRTFVGNTKITSISALHGMGVETDAVLPAGKQTPEAVAYGSLTRVTTPEIPVAGFNGLSVSLYGAYTEVEKLHAPDNQAGPNKVFENGRLADGRAGNSQEAIHVISEGAIKLGYKSPDGNGTHTLEIGRLTTPTMPGLDNVGRPTWGQNYPLATNAYRFLDIGNTFEGAQVYGSEKNTPVGDIHYYGGAYDRARLLNDDHFRPFTTALGKPGDSKGALAGALDIKPDGNTRIGINGLVVDGKESGYWRLVSDIDHKFDLPAVDKDFYLRPWLRGATNTYHKDGKEFTANQVMAGIEAPVLSLGGNTAVGYVVGGLNSCGGEQQSNSLGAGGPFDNRVTGGTSACTQQLTTGLIMDLKGVAPGLKMRADMGFETENYSVGGSGHAHLPDQRWGQLVGVYKIPLSDIGMKGLDGTLALDAGVAVTNKFLDAGQQKIDNTTIGFRAGLTLSVNGTVDALMSKAADLAHDISR
jgi:hypothetical protein